VNFGTEKIRGGDRWESAGHRESVTMREGTLQGSPLSPALFMVYMSNVVLEAVKWLAQRSGGRQLRREPRVSYWPLSHIGDINGVRVGWEESRPGHEPARAEPGG